MYLYRWLSLVAFSAGRPQDAASRTSFTLVAKPHASVFRLLQHHQFGHFQDFLQFFGAAMAP